MGLQAASSHPLGRVWKKEGWAREGVEERRPSTGRKLTATPLVVQQFILYSLKLMHLS